MAETPNPKPFMLSDKRETARLKTEFRFDSRPDRISELEGALRQSEERYQTLAKASPVGIFQNDPEVKATYINERGLEMLGLTLGQAVGTGWTKALHPDDRARVEREWTESVRGDGPFKSEYRFCRTDGSTIWVQGEAAGTFSEDGTVTGYIGTLTDITERKETELGLEEGAQRFHSLASVATVGILRADTRRLFTYMNDKWSKLSGLGPEEARGRGWLRSFHPEDRRRVFAEWEQALVEDKPCMSEFRFRRTDGTTIWLLGQAAAERSSDGRVIGYIGTITDITDLKLAEDALRKAHAEVKSSEEKFRTLLQSAPDGVLVFDNKGDITLVNAAAVDMFGYEQDVLNGKSVAEVLEPPESAGEEELLGTLLDLGGTGIGLHGRRRDGQVFPTEISIRTMPVGKETAHIAMVRDLTEQKLLERQFQEAQKMEAVGRLAGSIAHDFNNLLTVVTGYSALLREGMSSNHPALPRVEAIGRAAERAAQLTRGLLAFGRKQPVKPRVLNLNTVLGDMDRMLHSLVGEDVELLTILEDDLNNVEIDPAEVEQVVVNLATNARDAMPSGGRLTLETSNIAVDGTGQDRHATIQAGSYVLLSVTDTGVGMDEETKSHVFEPFFTTKERGKGTGLGLSTVHGTIRQGGGTIRARSEPGRGTEFKVYLPAVSKPITTVLETPMRRIVRIEATILLVEDESALRTLAAEVLRSKGYTVIEASGPAEAMTQLESSDPDLILTDVIMPKNSGPELIDEVRQTRPDIKVLYMSGYTSNALEGRASIKSEDVLQKPFTPSQLLQKVVDKLTAR